MTNPALTNTTLTAAGLTILRVVTGLIFVAHGWQKYSEFTIAGTQESFAGMGVPMASLAAPVVATLELVGGAALIVGVLTRIFAALLSLNMLGALILVHAAAGFYVTNGGYEFVLLLGAAALGIALVGPGRFSLDHTLFTRRGARAKVLV